MDVHDCYAAVNLTTCDRRYYRTRPATVNDTKSKDDTVMVEEKHIQLIAFTESLEPVFVDRNGYHHHNGDFLKDDIKHWEETIKVFHFMHFHLIDFSLLL